MSQQTAGYYAAMADKYGIATIPEILDGEPRPLLDAGLKLPIGALDQEVGLGVAERYRKILESLGPFVLAMADPDEEPDPGMQERVNTWRTGHVKNMPRQFLKPGYLHTGSLNTITTRAVTPHDFRITYLKQALHLRASDAEALLTASRAALLVTTALIEPRSSAHEGYTGFTTGVLPIAGPSVTYRGHQFSRRMLREQSAQWRPVSRRMDKNAE